MTKVKNKNVNTDKKRFIEESKRQMALLVTEYCQEDEISKSDYAGILKAIREEDYCFLKNEGDLFIFFDALGLADRNEYIDHVYGAVSACWSFDVSDMDDKEYLAARKNVFEKLKVNLDKIPAPKEAA